MSLQAIAEERRLRSKAAASSRRSAPSATALARANGKHKSQGSRWSAGDLSSPAYQSLAYVRNLAAHPDTSPYPHIVELECEAKYTLHENADANWLIRRWHELQDRETHEEGDEERASRGRCRETYRRALLAEAATQTELAAIDELLELKHGIDPRDYDARGMRIR